MHVYYSIWWWCMQFWHLLLWALPFRWRCIGISCRRIVQNVAGATNKTCKSNSVRSHWYAIFNIWFMLRLSTTLLHKYKSSFSKNLTLHCIILFYKLPLRARCISNEIFIYSSHYTEQLWTSLCTYTCTCRHILNRLFSGFKPAIYKAVDT